MRCYLLVSDSGARTLATSLGEKAILVREVILKVPLVAAPTQAALGNTRPPVIRRSVHLHRAVFFFRGVCASTGSPSDRIK
jgi:hypothetical protein